MNNRCLVSVYMITYNHGQFIAQALDSILMQKVNFNYEIVVGEDCSIDNTRDILLSYKKKHPERFKLLLHKKNIGAMNNQNAVLAACNGKYVAMCEGDDYWTDPYKLQKQVDFLETHNEYIAYAHNVNFKGLSQGVFSTLPTRTIKFEAFLGERIFHTASLMYRNTKFSIPNNILSSDRAIFLILATKGLFFYNQEVMAVYRKNMGGISKSIISSKRIKRDLSFFDIKEVKSLPKRSRLRLKYFVEETIFTYSTKIKLKDFIIYGFDLFILRARISSGILNCLRRELSVMNILRKSFRKIDW